MDNNGESDTNMDLDSEISSASSDIEEEDEEQVDSSLHNMSSLLLQLPFKRGLSKHYQGKSQSFISISKVSCLEELAKQENPYNKKLLKSSRSYGGFLSDAAQLCHNHSHISNNNNNLKTSSMGSYSSSLITTTSNTNRSSNPTKISINTSSISTAKTPLFI